ncbi:MAG: FkbM family methyltransferase [Caulobacteraceae bacterium]|nr:FkbM family methyltransferase [Caulobacteraceae bacterium]
MIRLLKRLPPVQRWLVRKYFWKSFNETGEYELKELERYVPKDRVAIDVGGNIGIYAFHLGRLAKEVIVFEPNPLYVERLRKAGLAQHLEQVALSDKEGVAELRIPYRDGQEDHGMASLESEAVPGSVLARAIQVPIRRLDDFAYKNVGFIKIDVEGHEEGVLKGALETVRRERPALLIEIEERHNPGGLQRIRDLLTGYDGFFFLHGERKPLAEFDQARHQREEDLKIAMKNRRESAYVNNFLFVPAA